jgi:hypothetical protein
VALADLMLLSLRERRIRDFVRCCVAGNPGALRSKNISRKGPRNCRSLRYATPNFLLRLVALMSFMRLSLMKAAHVALSGAAKQEIRVRFGRDDKGEGGHLWTA